MSLEVTNPFELYFGQDGRPIGAGSLYIGVAGLDPQIHPVDVFYDREMTVPAMQPLNISGGYVWNCCAPTKVFSAAANYSLKVLGKNGEQVFYCQSVESPDEASQINVKDFGAMIDGVTDDTAAIHAAITANPTARAFYIPSGTCLANIVIARNDITFVGDGINKTLLIGFDSSKPVIDYAKKLYNGLIHISVHHRHNATASIINARDARYITYDNAQISQLPNGSVYSYSVRALDMRKENPTAWTGYNYFNNCRFNYSLYGVDCDYDGKVASVCYFTNCIISWNGMFGARLVGVEVGGMLNCDVSTNGQIAIALNAYDETMYGGVYVKGRYFKIDGSWHEFNRSKTAAADYPNDLYIEPSSVGVTEINPRSARTNVGATLITQSQAQQTANCYSDVVIDSGMGQSKLQTLVKNGAFKHGASGWVLVNLTGGEYSTETASLPLGFETGLNANIVGGGVKGAYQKIYQSGETGNIIDDLSKFVGKTITMTAWCKNTGASASSLRIGFDTGASGSAVYFSAGSYLSRTPVGEYVKIVVTHKITGAEPRIMLGFRSTEPCIVTGFRAQFGNRVSDYEPKNITESGGEVYGVLTLNGEQIATAADVDVVLKVRSAADASIKNISSSINTDKKHPSFVFNSTTGKMYFSVGATASAAWRCTDGSGDLTPV